MSHGNEPSLRKQLAEARANIIGQLDQLYERSTRTRSMRWEGGPPDNRSVIAELQEQLKEIDALLGIEDKP